MTNLLTTTRYLDVYVFQKISLDENSDGQLTA